MSIFNKLLAHKIYLHVPIILTVFPTFYIYHHSGLIAPIYSLEAIEIYQLAPHLLRPHGIY